MALGLGIKAMASIIEIPAVVKARLGLDGERSWIVVDEANVFAWPGPDLRMLPGQGAESSAYGFLPPGFFRIGLAALKPCLFLRSEGCCNSVCYRIAVKRLNFSVA